jgi:hypothetical protein
MSPRKPDENGSPPAPAQGPDRTKPDAPRRIKKPEDETAVANASGEAEGAERTSDGQSDF